MRSMMLALVVMVGCATEQGEGLDIETQTPDIVSGTFTQDGMTIRFELAGDRMVVTTLEETPVTKAAPEAVLIDGLYIALGEMTCPVYPPRYRLE